MDSAQSQSLHFYRKDQQDYAPIQFNNIHESIKLLKLLIPDILNDDLVNIIYRKATNFMHITSKYVTQIAPQDKIKKNKQIVPVEIQNKEKDIVAKAFCNGGYDFLLLNPDQQGQVCIDETYYDTLLFRIMVEDLQKLEDFLENEKKIPGKSSKEELQRMSSMSINCKNNFPLETCEIIYNMIKGMHQIIPYDPVTKQVACSLYKTIQQHIIAYEEDITSRMPQSVCKKSRRAKEQSQFFFPQNKKQLLQFKAIKVNRGDSKRDKTSKYQLHRKWAPAYEELLLQLYKRTPNMSRIRDRFQLVFRQDSLMFTVEALRSKLYKILRVAIKQIQQLTKQPGSGRLAPLIKLDDNRVKLIINNHEFRKVRLVILDVYAKDFDMRLLNDAINKINLYVTQMEVQPRPDRSQRGDDYSPQRSVVSPPFFHPLNNAQRRVRETRAKYNRKFTHNKSVKRAENSAVRQSQEQNIEKNTNNEQFYKSFR